ncbi:bleomycin resistance protein [Macrococcus lamae]|uniref:Bleomycin resistance protein n=1 Tax=Macrococcus lamae TaxID=198484 RepID=A0A4V3BEZ7_9STAP|nr:VOC family protein [Macrococcus lamae]TDM05172.1 VOC family protein [Macrococcus lamae]
MDYNALIPEFEVSDIEQSKQFYIDLLGFKLEYERPEDQFVFLSKEGSQLMLEQTTDKELVYPFGRGVNFSFGISDVENLYEQVVAAEYPIHRPLVTREFRVGDHVVTPKEFSVLDPDGYFLRFSD